VIPAPRGDVWRVVSDPYHLPRWWPGVTRVEGVYERKGGSGSQWTKVFETAKGKAVRADFKCRFSRDREAYGWEQEIVGSPFEKYLRSAVTEITLSDSDSGTLLEIETDQKLRGVSRFGGGRMLKRATARQLDQALKTLAESFSSADGGKESDD
jgi:carbon monoxide dehydrogenase subunit G